MTRARAKKALALESEDHEGFGAAMMACQDRSGSCAYSGVCSFDWECFGPSSYIDADRHLEAVRQRLTGMNQAERKRLIAALGDFLPDAKIVHL